MPIGLKLLAIMLLSISTVAFAVSLAFAFLDIFSLVIAVPSGIIAFAMLLILLKDYKPADKKNSKKKKTEKTTEKNAKWYIDKIIAALVVFGVLLAIFLIAVGYDENEAVMYTGLLLFPFLSLLISPNAVFYSLKDMNGWKRIFYGKGNLEKYKDNKAFYWVKTPVAFEKRLFWAVVKDQILNLRGDHAHGFRCRGRTYLNTYVRFPYCHARGSLRCGSLCKSQKRYRFYGLHPAPCDSLRFPCFRILLNECH